jgi:predicted TPR repeat methyltransferase
LIGVIASAEIHLHQGYPGSLTRSLREPYKREKKLAMAAAENISLEEAVKMGIRLHQQQEYERAGRVYEQVLAVWPECADALHFSGLLAYHQQKDIDKAIQLVAQSVAMAPDHPDFWNNYGNLLKASGRLLDAAAAYRRAVELRPSFPDAYNNLGLIFQEDKDYQGAIVAYRDALRYQPNHIAAHLNLGKVFGMQGRWAEAEASYQKVIEVYPAHSEAYYRLGWLYWRQERLDEAAEMFRKSAENNPNHSDSFLGLGRLFERRGRTEEAVEAYRQAIKVDPQNWSAYQALGTMLNLVSRNDEAAVVIKQWAVGEPENPIPRHLLAAVLGENVPSRATDEYVIKAFDLFADSFDRQLHRLQYCAPQLVSEELKLVRGQGTSELDILDAGCGTGLCAPLLRSSARRLVGVDLSPGMLEKAREGGDYDELYAAELTAFMAQAVDQFDVIVSADTFCYFGDLESVIKAAAAALRPGGHLVFTVEESAALDSSIGFLLTPSGRYAHTKDYVRQVLQKGGLAICAISCATLRMEYDKPVAGLLTAARKDGPPLK